MSEFFHMGGYAVYVWTSYAVFATVLIGVIVQPVLSRRKLEKQLKQSKRRQQTRRESAT